MIDANRVREGNRFIDMQTGETDAVTRVLFAPLGAYVEHEIDDSTRSARRNMLRDFDSKFDPLI